jgi:hypothetical protein
MITDNDIQEIKRTLTTGAAYKTFFESINSPEWIIPLLNDKFFSTPEPPLKEKVNVSGHETYGISFPEWPQSRYLVRMANTRSIDVLRAVEAIFDSGVDNIYIHSDIIEILKNYPVSEIHSLIDREIDWVKEQSQLYLYLPQKLFELIEYVCGEDPILAIKIVDATFGITLQQSDNEGDPRRLKVERFDSWQYNHLLIECTHCFLNHRNLQIVDFLCSELSKVCEGLNPILLDTKIPRNDSSAVWRSTIEDSDQNIGWDYENALVTALREVGVKILAEWPEEFEKFVVRLEREPWIIFRRLILYFLSQLPHKSGSISKKYLLDREYFESITTRHEYITLLKALFDTLSVHEQDIIWGWIDEPGEKEEFRRHNWYSTLEPFLSDEKKEVLRRLNSTRGNETHFDQPFRMETFSGPSSPISPEDLLALSDVGLTKFIIDWRPTSDFFSASLEGLGDVLQTCVSNYPERFARLTSEFQQLQEPIYFRSLVYGFEAAMKASRSFDLTPVLSLCLDLCSRKDNPIPSRINRMDDDLDPDWSWCSSGIVRLITTAAELRRLQPENVSIALDIVEKSLDDSNPTEDYEQKALEYQDPFTLAINTVRGTALNALIAISNMLFHIGKLAEHQERIESLLSSRLSENEFSLSVRSVYGGLFDALISTLPDWTRTNLSVIFPSDENSRQKFLAAWNTYIVYANPRAFSYSVLAPFYKAYVSEKLKGSPQAKKRGPSDPNVRFAEHLASHFLNNPTWNSETELLVLFFKNARPKYRASFWRHLGRNLAIFGKQYPHNVVQRLQSLWDARSADPSGTFSGEESATFGWWVVSGAFPSLWVLTNLTSVLKQSDVERVEQCIPFITECSVSFPRESLEAISALVARQKNNYLLQYHLGEIHSIIQNGVASKDIIVPLVDLLVANGFNDFLNYLNTT